eukprot:TRINITY_DN8813_c0_g1_i1.p1 TRINITY_DN8813_c0_g1~~TRINITY_DN8813_c0_g1_i1.p1  ORF type:complete len:327 (-),score=18.86 TRINITY_DN8813_c0_g1_i1:320-1300(-)
MRRSTGPPPRVGLGRGVVDAQELLLRPPQASSRPSSTYGIIRNNDRLLNSVARQSKLPGAALSVKVTDDGGKFQILEIQIGDETFLFRSQKVIGQANRTVSVMKQDRGVLHSVGPVQHLLHQWEVTRTRKIERQRSLEGARLRQKASVGKMQLLDPTRSSKQASIQREQHSREVAARKRQRQELRGPCPSSQTLVYAFIQYDDSVPLVPISPPGNVVSIENDDEYHTCSALYHRKQAELLNLQARLTANCNDFKELALAMNAQKVAAKQREISRFRQKLHVVRKDSITKLKEWYHLLSDELRTMAGLLDAYYQQKMRTSLSMVTLL